MASPKCKRCECGWMAEPSDPMYKRCPACGRRLRWQSDTLLSGREKMIALGMVLFVGVPVLSLSGEDYLACLILGFIMGYATGAAFHSNRDGG